MNKPVLSFSTEQLNRVFPFHLLINKDLVITSFGKSVKDLYPVKAGLPLFQFARILYPQVDKVTFELLRKLTDQVVLLNFVNSSDSLLKGQFEYMDSTGQLLFYGSSFDEVLPGDGQTEVGFHLRKRYPYVIEYDTLVQALGETGRKLADHRKIEEQLKINEKRYRDLFSYSQAFICTHDMEGRFLTVNPATCELMGYTEEELAGRSLADFLPPADVKNFRSAYLDKVINEGSAKGVFRIMARNDRKAYLLYKNFKVEEENSEPYIIGFSQDITDRIKTEKELLLTKRVTEEAHRAKETFLANMSHEIRTPMTGILGIANLLSKTKLDEQQRKFTKLISESANNLLNIVNDVLDIEKITARKLDLEFIPFKLEDKVFTTLQSFQFKAEDKNINLTMNSSLPDDLVVIGDPYRLGQVLNNLLSNAIKFTNEGEIAISIDYKQTDDNSLLVMIQVQDTGIGIKPEILPEIFKPFLQGSSDTTRKYGGTGLGLSICKHLVEMQGGRISVESVLNRGTAFSFSIPYEKGDSSALVESDEDAVDYKDLESIRILVAEDVDLNKFLVKNILESWGCEVTLASNGREAVEKVKNQFFDLILMDIQMPEMDGITATNLIRKLNTASNPVIEKSAITKKIRTLNIKQKSTIPIIAITANALKGDGERYLKMGMNGYITKPYTEEKLFQAINQVIRSKSKLRAPAPLNPAPPEPVQPRIVPPKDRLYDLSMVEMIGKNDIVFTKKIISVFLETMPETLDSLVKYGEVKDFDQISKTAHKMKSQIDLLNINDLKETIRELETTCPERDNSKSLIAKTNDVLGRTFDQLKELI